jgi:hypothetical protein
MPRAAIALVVAFAFSQPAPTGVVVGRVVDQSSHSAVSHAIVTLRCRGKSSFGYATSDRVMATDDGQFAFTRVMPGACALEAAKSGYSGGAFGQTRPAGRGRDVLVTPEEPRLNLEVPLWPYFGIDGIITDDSGEPLVGFPVHLYQTDAARADSGWTAIGLAATDDRGAYAFGQLRPGRYVVAAGPSGLDRPHGFTAYAPVFFPGVASARDATEIELDAGADRHGVDVRMHAVTTSRVDGTVVLTNGRPAVTAVTLVWAEDAQAPLWFQVNAVRSDATGHFIFPSVAAGHYLVKTNVTSVFSTGDGLAEREGAGWAIQPLDVGTSDASVSLALRPYLSVSGRVIYEGTHDKPELSALLPTVFSTGPTYLPSENRAEWSPATGTFTLGGRAPDRCVIGALTLPPGWSVKSVTLDDRDITDLPIDLTADLHDVTLTLTDRPGAISGTVHGRTGAIDLETSVLLFPADPERWTSAYTHTLVRDVRPDEHGRYALASLTPADYFIVAVADGALVDFPRPDFLAQLSRGATRVHVDLGAAVSVDLVTSALK